MNQIFTVWKKEIKDTLRDRRTLAVAILMPIIMMPLSMVGSLKVAESQQKAAAEQVVLLAIENQEQNPTLTQFFQSQDKVEIQPFTGDAKDMINKGEVNVVLSVPSGFEQNLKDNIPTQILIYENSTNNKSNTAESKVVLALNLLNQKVAAELLTTAKINPSVLNIIIGKPQDIASEQERGGFFLGLLLPMFIVIFTLIGGMYIAIDISAGEKERKTLEALLLTPLSRLKIVTGKFLAVASTSITSVILSISSLYIAFKIWPPNLGSGFTVQFSLPISTVGIMLAIGILLSIMFAGMLLAVAIFAKSYKEAQNYITPFYVGAILPVAILGSYPFFKPSFGFFFIPAVNAVLLFKENLLGVYDASHILATIGSLVFFAIVSIIIAAKIYSKESILFRD